jgi:hypothetical protein
MSSISFHKNIYKTGQNVMILLFSGEAGHGTKNETHTIGANGRATAETSKSGGFADSLNAGS